MRRLVTLLALCILLVSHADAELTLPAVFADHMVLQRDCPVRNKLDVGDRLALIARQMAYGEDVPASGPVLADVDYQSGKAIVTFKHAEGGLACQGETLSGFALAGADRRFVWAKAEIVGDTVIVTSPQVQVPAFVRYGWADNPQANLTNRLGLPTAPFRTDR